MMAVETKSRLYQAHVETRLKERVPSVIETDAHFIIERTPERKFTCISDRETKNIDF